MNQVTIEKTLEGWNQEQLTNLQLLLGGNDKWRQPTIENIKNKLKWLYCSSVRAKTRTAALNVINKTIARIKKTDLPEQIKADDITNTPLYSQLLLEATRHSKSYEKNAKLEEAELNLALGVIITALQQMKPHQRIEFFSTTISTDKIISEAKIKSNNIKGPMTTIAAIGTAQASGFGVYLASTTALGFLTHAVGLTLPFAFYTGLTSTIAFIIGPVGWLGAGFWGMWKLTQPKWRHIIPALLYIISINNGPLNNLKLSFYKEG